MDAAGLPSLGLAHLVQAAHFLAEHPVHKHLRQADTESRELQGMRGSRKGAPRAERMIPSHGLISRRSEEWMDAVGLPGLSNLSCRSVSPMAGLLTTTCPLHTSSMCSSTLALIDDACAPHTHPQWTGVTRRHASFSHPSSYGSMIWFMTASTHTQTTPLSSTPFPALFSLECFSLE